MDLSKKGFFRFFFKNKDEHNEKIEIILEDLSKYLDKFSSDIRSGFVTKLIKKVLGENIKIPSDEKYNKMVKIVKQLINGEISRENTNRELHDDLIDIEKFLSSFLQDTNKMADPVDINQEPEKISAKIEHIFKIYIKFGELKFLIFREKFGKVEPFSNLKINFKNTLEIWGTLKSVSYSLKKLNSQKGWIFKNKFVVKCYEDLKNIYDDIKKNISATGLWLSPIRQSRILYPKLQNCKKYIYSAINSRIINNKIHPDDYDNVKSSLLDLYESFSDVSDALFDSKFEEIDFKNFHIYHNISNNSSAMYYISILEKDLSKLYKYNSRRKTSYINDLYKKLYLDYKNLKGKIKRKTSDVVKHIKEFSNSIIKKQIIPNLDMLKGKISANYYKVPIKIINNLYDDYVSIVKRFSITQIDYIKKNVHELIDNSNTEVSNVYQNIDYLEVRKENLLNSFSNLKSHMDEFEELKLYLYQSFGKKLGLLFEKIWLKLKKSISRKNEIYILREQLGQQEKKLRSNFSNLYKYLNKNEKFCDILKNRKTRKEFVNKVYYNYSEFEFIKKIVNDNIAYINKFYSYWNNFNIAEFNKKYFKDKKISVVSKTFTRISDVMDSLNDDYDALHRCILDIENSINTDVLMSGDNRVDSKDIKILKENLEELKKQESLCSSKRQKSKISKKIESMQSELDKQQEIQTKKQIQKAINRFNNIPVNGTRIIGKIILVKSIMSLGPNSFLNIVISTDKIDFFKLKLESRIPDIHYDCGTGYSIEIAKFDVSISRFVQGSMHVYLSFQNSNAGTMIVDILSKMSSKLGGISRWTLNKIGDSLSKLDNLDYLYKIGIKNKTSIGKLDLFPCNIVKEDPIKINDSNLNIGSALSTYKSIKSILKPLQSSRLRKFFKGKTKYDELFYEIKQLPNEIKLASRDPEVCRSLIRKCAGDLDTFLLDSESSKHYTELINVKSQLDNLEKYLVGTTKKVSRKKYKHCNISGSCLFYKDIISGMSVLVTGESSAGVIKSQFVDFPNKIDELSGMIVGDLEINTEKMDMKFLPLVVNLFNNSLCSNFNTKLRVYILTSSEIIKFIKRNVITITSKSKKNIYLR